MTWKVQTTFQIRPRWLMLVIYENIFLRFNGQVLEQKQTCLLFPGSLRRQLTAWSVVKICFVVFVFPHCCLPLFHLEELFPFTAWKQAAGQQQVSLVVRSVGQSSCFFLSESTPIVSDHASCCSNKSCFKKKMFHPLFIFTECFCICNFFLSFKFSSMRKK